MKVGELIEKLKKLDPKLELLCYTEDETLQVKGHMFRLFDIESVEISEGEKRRVNGVPTLKLGSGPVSKKLAILNVTGDF